MEELEEDSIRVRIKKFFFILKIRIEQKKDCKELEKKKN